MAQMLITSKIISFPSLRQLTYDKTLTYENTKCNNFIITFTILNDKVRQKNEFIMENVVNWLEFTPPEDILELITDEAARLEEFINAE